MGIQRSSRENSAVEATRTDARRYADAVVDRVDTWPAGAQQLRDILESSTSPESRLFQVHESDERTRVVARFRGRYTDPMPLFASADKSIARCYAFDFPRADLSKGQVQIESADDDGACLNSSKNVRELPRSASTTGQ
ncbi:hypothetical protein DSC45_34735 [Streptomyces sp. YIM 130001]|nr:hypothetical protein DSC45_34735 [Streptomyces sp. YIM 130001]